MGDVMPTIKEVLLATEGESFSVWEIFTDNQGARKVHQGESVLDAREKAVELCKQYGFDRFNCGKIKVEDD
jgi:hypothetical protein